MPKCESCDKEFALSELINENKSFVEQYTEFETKEYYICKDCLFSKIKEGEWKLKGI